MRYRKTSEAAPRHPTAAQLRRTGGWGLPGRNERAPNESHDRLVCIQCATTIELEEPALTQLQRQAALAHGFVLTRPRHVLYGLCSVCRTIRAPRGVS